MAKDRTWMYGSSNSSDEFLNGLFEFCNSALDHQARTGADGFYCPCANCVNVDKVNSIHVLREHVIRNGFRPQYHVWVWHGEEGVYEGNRTLIDGHGQECTIQAAKQDCDTENEFGNDDYGDDGSDEEASDNENDRLDEMMEGVEDELGKCPLVCDSLLEASQKPLYASCENLTKLSAVLTLCNIKSKYGWRDTSFTTLLEAVSEMSPEGNELSKSNYNAKKLMLPFDLEHQMIHACPNDCVLYRNEYDNLDKCPRCGKSCYKHQGIGDKKGPLIQNDAVQSTAPVHETEKQFAVSSKKRGPKNPKGRGPTKGLGVKEDMHLEYDSKGQPCGKWRGKYGTHVGLCIRKLSILHSWDEVPEGLKKTLWDDTMDLFHIEADEAKKNLFLSAVAQRFRDFKSKLVSGWITLKRPRTLKKKRKRNENGEGKENENEQGQGNEIQPPKRKPYEIWPHITKDVWDAFVSKKTTAKEVEKCGKASTSALKRKFYHHLGPKTYEQKRKEWFQEGFYPSCSASLSVASNSTTSKIKTDRVYDWWCSLHEKDERGNRRIVNPETKKLADAVIGWKNKEATGEFSFEANKDALYMVLGKDHDGRVRGQGGVRLGLKKAFQGEYSASRSTASVRTASDLEAVRSSIREEVREEVKHEVRKEMYTILKQLGITSVQLNEDEPGEQLKQHAASEPEEETPCRLLLPEGGENDGDLIVVADGHAQPRSEHAKVHFKEVSSSFFRVSIDNVRDGCQDLELPLPREDVSLHSLKDARGSFVAWPCVWVRFSDEIIKKQIKKIGSKSNCQGWKVDGTKKKMEKNEVSKQSKRKELQSQPNGQFKERIPSKGSTTLLDQQAVDSLSKACFWLHECTRRLVDGKSIEVFLDKNQFHYADDTSTYITKEDVCEFLSGKMLNVPFIQLFMSALYEDLRACDSLSRIGWLCPQKICAEKCLGDQDDVKYYIEHSIQECTRVGNVLIVAPYHQDTHWMLLVISPSTNTVHQFDSAHVEPPRLLLLKSCLNSVLKKLSGAPLRRDSIPQWKSIKCAQQQGGVGCGYYVMRYMYDVVLSCIEAKDLETLFKTSREGTFTSAEINEVRDKCAMFITDTCF